jgi:hypothetical protein
VRGARLKIVLCLLIVKGVDNGRGLLPLYGAELVVLYMEVTVECGRD